MANEEHLKILKQGVSAWNEWRTQNRYVRPDLSDAVLCGVDFTFANLYRTNIRNADFKLAYLHSANLAEVEACNARFDGAILRKAQLDRAKLDGATLWGAHLSQAHLAGASLKRCNLRGADLSETTIFRTDFTGANLCNANLRAALLIETKFEDAVLTDCKVYGVSAWRLSLKNAEQSDLIITSDDEAVITVDNLEVAQFIYLLLHNEKIRHVIDTITSKVVPILGRFTQERKPFLDAIREELRRYDLLPVMFDFTPPASRDFTETISTLAHMARFIIADITDPRSIPQELERIVPGLPSVPVVPLLQADATEYGMFEHFKAYPWVLAIHRYRDLADLLASLKDTVIAPAEKKARQLQGRRIKRA